MLNYLKTNPKATRKEIAEAIGNITENGVKFNIGRLQQYGCLKREGGRKKAAEDSFNSQGL
ncbi:MAG: winged helix-turn-helix domain-containing protein [Prevotella sp.]|nr:winged helix-turn-helix domain-containing protein [Prevotella sp.]